MADSWNPAELNGNQHAVDSWNPAVLNEFMKYNSESNPVKTATGEFTTSENTDGISSVNVGFRPDAVLVIMEFSTGVTHAMAGSVGEYSNSVWDLRPIENAQYNLNLGAETGETGISNITDTGFEYRAHGSNTTNKHCTYTAVKWSTDSAVKVTKTKRSKKKTK